MSTSSHLLVVNQHGDNRGDEAALRGMVSALRERLPGCRFTVLHQFAAPASAIEIDDVDYLPLRVPIHEAMRLSLWAALAFVGIRLAWLPGPIGRQMLGAYGDADIAISAPGGPYFGDLYAGHEVVHWFYVWVAHLHQKPLFLYQPSSGPFENRWLRPLRKRGFSWFDELTVRETISADHIEQFTGRRPSIGSDSALQREVPASGLEDAGLVTGTFRDPGPEHRTQHDAEVVEVLVRLTESGRRILLLPQLHGPRHRDQPYLEELAGAARARGADVDVASETTTSDEQRALVAASDLVLAGRYHPLVFAVSAGVPALVIPYEHKARGVATAAGLEGFVVEIAELGRGLLTQRLDTLLEQLPECRQTIAQRAPALKRAAESTSDRVVAIVRSHSEVQA
ncbi:MAG: hypothetical protein GY698_11965 [Actinomycetia bacterium]|nr:hypothetical protein [Actinomycetes bacterium]